MSLWRPDLPESNPDALGFGSKTSNFDTISLHTYPNLRPAIDLWPDLDPQDAEREIQWQEKLAVPFVGVSAATLVVAEALRVLHGGPAYGQLKFRLATPATCHGNYLGDYGPERSAGIPFVTIT